MEQDIAHWSSLKPPLSPSPGEVEIYKANLLPGKTLLLGQTPALIDLCDIALDSHPFHPMHEKVVAGDWEMLLTSGMIFDNIIGDGVINLAQWKLLNIVSNCCDRFISRVFTKKQVGMKYATFFPVLFPRNPRVEGENEECPILIWDF
jgi:hypothetical protein